MPVSFQCGCGGWLQVGDEHSRGQVNCPHCGRAVAVPAATAPMHVAVPGGACAPAWDGGERLRRVSAAGLWLGITGCASGILFFLVALLAGATAVSSHGRDGAPTVLAVIALLLALVGAVASIMGIVFGAKGLKAENVRYKPHAVGGLVTGIAGTCIAGCLMAMLAITVFGNQQRDLFRVSTERLGGDTDSTLDSGITDSARGKVRKSLSDLKDAAP